MSERVNIYQRRSRMRFDEIYYWTATINQWQPLLSPNKYKDIVISSLQYLSDIRKIDVFGFVIMPTHIHLIWKMLELNGKEAPHSSFLKFTAHKFLEMLRKEDSALLLPYRVNASNKKHEFWQRDPIAEHLYTQKMAFQKLNHIHANPLAKHWGLAKNPSDYMYSSARYYEMNDQGFSFLKNLKQQF